MLATLIEPETFNYPPYHKIELHVTTLKKTLEVQHCHAQEMVAYYYQCGSWGELKNCATKLKLSESASILNSREDHLTAEQGRVVLERLLSSEDLSDIKKWPLLPNSISFAISKRRLDWLLDDEVGMLVESVFEGRAKPYKTVSKALLYHDTNIATHVAAQVFRNRWIKDFKFGFTFYCYMDKNDNHVTLTIKEMDSYFYPPGDIEKCFTRAWFPQHVEGYLDYLMRCLRKAGFHGELILYTVNNHNVVDPTKSHIYETIDVSGLETLRDNLKGKKNYISDTRMIGTWAGLSLSF